ncbi:MAG: gamma-glutamyl-gamma-aminobutyrate hydrolase family protein [Bacillota bacterium]|jgi:putative glutamine amidotransferase
MEQVCKRREKGERPVIGVTPLLDQERESLWMLPGYFQGVLDAGGIPMMLPLCDDRALLQDVADLCDGFLFTGGYDVSPTVYGETTAYDTVIASPERDDMEAALLWEILRRDRPLFGICRGLQIINAALGGSLYQDLTAQHPSETEHCQPAPYDRPIHTVSVTAGTPLFSLVGREEFAVNSYHHQAVRDLAPDLKTMAVSEDGLIEAAYMPGKKFVWAVQWHPEYSLRRDEESPALFRRFIAACAD